MQILGNIFSVILYLSFIGSIVSFAALFSKKVLHLVQPLWFGAAGLLFYLVPVIVPQVRLIPGERQTWRYGFRIAAIIWITGAFLFALCYLARTLFAARAMRKCTICGDARVLKILTEICTGERLQKIPRVLFGEFKDPVCVVTILRPSILLNKRILPELTDPELTVILRHEILHIKRKHHLLQRFYDLASVLHWCNPFVWISKNDFELTCEMDCDRKVLKSCTELAPGDYTRTMLHLLEMSSGTGKNTGGRIAALGFLMAKQRFAAILAYPKHIWRIITLAILGGLVAAAVLLSMSASRTYFYPYPALMGSAEYSDPDAQRF